MGQAAQVVKWAALAALALLGLPAPASAAPRLVIWAWERPEDLRFAPPQVEVAAQTGFVVLTGEGVFVRRRRFPLRTMRPPSTALVHVQIDHHRRLAWTPTQRAQAAAAVLQLAQAAGVRRVQVDFEVRQSERRVLLDLLADVRRGLPSGVGLSMTALASWCETEAWLNRAPVDEIVPMLFRMGPGGDALKVRLETGGDFAEPRCRTALAISTDAPLRRAPAGRRVYLFNPRSWTAADFEAARRRVETWSSGGG
ncbi:hypothetical protein [Phenylobacterium sp.]|uniref:hypothetical protein n=1 Tax=Phenylobacterium sp. TaxID=1871053 RepID=UPI002DE34953|nr:hypothetical protein [Phenylobacterium sp.]